MFAQQISNQTHRHSITNNESLVSSQTDKISHQNLMTITFFSFRLKGLSNIIWTHKSITSKNSNTTLKFIYAHTQLMIRHSALEHHPSVGNQENAHQYAGTRPAKPSRAYYCYSDNSMAICILHTYRRHWRPVQGEPDLSGIS